jgi:hypothetical protein
MNTAQKTCFKCGAEKPLTEYYKHSKMADGHLNKCKECTKRDVKKHRRENDSVREYDRKRGNRQSYQCVKERRARYPMKYKAHTAVGNAVRDGRLVKPDCCENCGSDFALHGHHDDYAKPLSVRWLCAKCHQRWHAENGEGKNAR